MSGWIASPWIALAFGYVVGALPVASARPWTRAAVDLVKGAVAPLAALAAIWATGGIEPLSDSTWLRWLGDPGIAGWAAAVGVLLGRCYPPFHALPRGKGILTAFGSLLVVAPATALAAALGWILTGLPRMAPARFAGAGGPRAVLAGVLAAVVAHLVLYPGGSPLWIAGFLVFLVLLQHETEMDALLDDSR